MPRSALASRLAERYADHPAVVMWHVNNEYGCHNWHCFCDVSAEAFRSWLRDKYDGLDELNDAWGTAFWSQHYARLGGGQAAAGRRLPHASRTPASSWTGGGSPPTSCSRCYRAEADAVRARREQPVTTNFMSFFKPVDYRRLGAASRTSSPTTTTCAARTRPARSSWRCPLT